MSVNYNIPTLTARLQQVANAIDAGAGHGVMRLVDASGNILSTLTLSKPCGTVSGSVLTFGGMSLIDPAAALTGIATGGRIEDSNGTIIIFGLTVGQPTAVVDIFLTPTTLIQAGQTVAITSAVINSVGSLGPTPPVSTYVPTFPYFGF